MFFHFPKKDLSELVNRDPVFRFLTWHSNSSFFEIFGLAFGIQTIYLAVGFIFPVGDVPGGRFKRAVFEELAFGDVAFIGAYALMTACLWTFYWWQPVGYLQVIRRLNANGVIAPRNGQSVNLTEYVYGSDRVRGSSELFSQPIKKEIMYWIPFSVIYVLSALTLYRENGIHGLVWAIYLAPVYLNIIYFSVVIYTRQHKIVMEIISLNSFYEIIPVIFHPDKCNGLRPLGRFFMISLPIVGIVQFLLLVVLAVFPQSVLPADFSSGTPDSNGADSGIGVTTAFLIVGILGWLFFVGKAFFDLLMVPILVFHRIMKSYKYKLLSGFGSEALKTITLKHPQDPQRIEWAVSRYENIEREAKEWPITFLDAPIAGIAAAISLLLPIIVIIRTLVM